MSVPVVVTGATGRLGGRVARRLADAGVALRLVVRDPSRAPELPDAFVAQAAYGQPDALRRALDGARIVPHGFRLGDTWPCRATRRVRRRCGRGRCRAPRLHVLLRCRSSCHALAGTMDIDLYTEPLGTGSDGASVYLRDIWPSSADVTEVIGDAVRSEMFDRAYTGVFRGDEAWAALDAETGDRYRSGRQLDLFRNPPYFDGMTGAGTARRHHRRPGARRAR